ncbi:arsenic resistance N-acetyltransferase ArsN2 [Balneatrix alpica]|uniref:arsenic resistance N-acetyltransferase ArsN2 n=1 Tax=Balneatrix alpica TaxID=75684 RepID=UPI00273A29D4|nr:arsenic resistance N-acetyltransferase ArsN2 [Balneatrix alpica]
MQIKPLLSIEQLKQVLSACELPVADLDALPQAKFFCGMAQGSLVAVAGIELYDEVALLRSLAVLPPYRHTGIGSELVDYLESFATQQGVAQLYLLTTTAEAYFRRRGYDAMTRHEAPSAIQATSQFSALCPASSALLTKQLGANPGRP